MEQIELKITGRIAKNKLKHFVQALDCSVINENQIIVFCDYSNFDIPIGHIFRKVKNVASNTEILGDLILEEVSQGFARPYDIIPKGHKTICKFRVEDKAIRKTILTLPEINDWYGSDRFLLLGT